MVEHHNKLKKLPIVFYDSFDVLINNNTKQSNQSANIHLNFCKLTN